MANPAPAFPELTEYPLPQEDAVETFFNSTDDVTKEVAKQAMADLGISSDRLTTDEKINIVEKMNERGAFLLKGAVKDAAEVLDCSQATIYRYLSELRDRGEQSKLA